MFNHSTQMKHWMFENTQEINELRTQLNSQYIKKHGNHMTVNKTLPSLYLLILSHKTGNCCTRLSRLEDYN